LFESMKKKMAKSLAKLAKKIEKDKEDWLKPISIVLYKPFSYVLNGFFIFVAFKTILQ
jgi:hypothetical protein